jgi:hypothetical protein
VKEMSAPVSAGREGDATPRLVIQELVPPRRLLVNGRPIRLRWLQRVIWSFLAANIGALVVSALYYVFVQHWGRAVGFHGHLADRHDIRSVYEALLVAMFIKSQLANWRRKDLRAPAWYVLISPLLIAVVASPIAAAGIWLTYYALPYVSHSLLYPSPPPELSESSALVWLGTFHVGYQWQPVLIGILVGPVMHWAYAPAGNTVQLFFVGRAVHKTRDAIASGENDPYRHLPRWPMGPIIRERAAWTMDNDLPVPYYSDIASPGRVMALVRSRLAATGRRRLQAQLGAFTTVWLTNGAVFLAGRKRAATLRVEWSSHLAGETGQAFPVPGRLARPLSDSSALQ